MDIGQLLQFGILIALGVFASEDINSYVVQGPLHDVLVNTMKEQFHLHKITLTAPHKIIRRGACKWVMAGELLGEYGVLEGFLTVRFKDCAEYTEASWNSTFPCSITKQPLLRTTCRGPLPEGTENAEFKMYVMLNIPSRWDGVVPEEPAVPSAQAVPFDNALNCHALGGLLLAKLIQENGVYKGQGAVTCQRAATFTYIQAHDGLDGYLRVTVNNKLEAEVIESKNISWNSGFNTANELIVTTVTNGNTSDQSTLKYTKELLSHDKLIVDGEIHSYQYSNTGPWGGEPRLCPVTSKSSACAIMTGLSTSNLNALGNLTGFFLMSWGAHDTFISVRGYVLGTKGVMVGQYTAPVLNGNDPSWMELPLRSRFQCKPRIYAFSDCSNVQNLADKVPSLGLFQRDEELRLFNTEMP